MATALMAGFLLLQRQFFCNKDKIVTRSSSKAAMNGYILNSSLGGVSHAISAVRTHHTPILQLQIQDRGCIELAWRLSLLTIVSGIGHRMVHQHLQDDSICAHGSVCMPPSMQFLPDLPGLFTVQNACGPL